MRVKRIICEGHDLCGKDTRVGLLIDRGFRAVSQGARGPLAVMRVHSLDLGSVHDKDTVYNRGWLSEWVYSNLHRRNQQLSQRDLCFLSLQHDSIGAVLDLQMVGALDIAVRFKHRGDAELTLDQVFHAKYLYQSELSRPWLPANVVVNYDTDALLSYADRVQCREWEYGMGNPQAAIVVVIRAIDHAKPKGYDDSAPWFKFVMDCATGIASSGVPLSRVRFSGFHDKKSVERMRMSVDFKRMKPIDVVETIVNAEDMHS